MPLYLSHCCTIKKKTRGKIDCVLASVVGKVAALGSRVIELRADRRRSIKQAGSLVLPLTLGLRTLVSDFHFPIAGHVHFGLIEACVQAMGWPHFDLHFIGIHLSLCMAWFRMALCCMA